LPNGPASPLSSNETAANRAPEARSAEAQQQTAAASPATLGAVTPSDVPAALNGSRLSAADLELLLTRGDTLFASGDLTSARLFYERAAQAGNGPAALRLAETYDPQFLKRAHLRGVQGDIATATFWYKRASNLGMSEAGILLGGLPSK
jgi:TPR repeat protein